MPTTSFNFNFTTVSKTMGRTGTVLPDNIIRITAHRSMAISANIVDLIGSVRNDTPTGQAVRFNIEVDIVNKAIRLTSNASGFSFRLNEQGVARGSVPSDMKKHNIPVGDYLLIEGAHNIFQLAQ